MITTPREQLVSETDAAEAAQLQAVMGVLSTACTSTASDSSAQTHDMALASASHTGSQLPITHGDADGQGETAMASSAEQDSIGGMDLDAAAPSVAELAGSIVTEQAAAAAAAERAAPADPNEDIFGGAQTQSEQTPTNQQEGTSATSHHASQDTLLNQPQSSHPSVPAVSVSNNSSQDITSGFVYDESSGTWYNADSGYYYDATQGLYGDASSGQWYSYTDGAYQPVC